jgi:hypothetical protein
MGKLKKELALLPLLVFLSYPRLSVSICGFLSLSAYAVENCSGCNRIVNESIPCLRLVADRAGLVR